MLSLLIWQIKGSCMSCRSHQIALQGCLKVFNWTSASIANEAPVNTEGQGCEAHWTQQCVCFERQHWVYKQKHSAITAELHSSNHFISVHIRFLHCAHRGDRTTWSKWLRASIKNKREKYPCPHYFLIIPSHVRVIKSCILQNAAIITGSCARLTWEFSPRSLFC